MPQRFSMPRDTPPPMDCRRRRVSKGWYRHRDCQTTAASQLLPAVFSRSSRTKYRQRYALLLKKQFSATENQFIYYYQNEIFNEQIIKRCCCCCFLGSVVLNKREAVNEIWFVSI